MTGATRFVTLVTVPIASIVAPLARENYLEFPDTECQEKAKRQGGWTICGKTPKIVVLSGLTAQIPDREWLSLAKEFFLS